MAFSEVNLSLNIQSNVNYPVNINILGNPYNLLDTSNATTEYRYDLTSFTFGNENLVQIQYKANGATTFSVFSGQISNQSLQDVVNVLNLLGIGFFSVYTSGGNTYIGTYNDNYTFGQLNIYAASIINTNFLYGSGFDNDTLALAVQSDNKVVVGGIFSSYNGVGASKIIRLNTDGSIDTSFLYAGGFGAGNVNTIAIQSDGKILVGGSFTDYQGIGANGIIRLLSDGTIDPSFVYGSAFTGGAVFNITIQPSGDILVGGTFTAYQGTGANRIIRLKSNGSIDGTFVYGAGFAGGPSPKVYSMALQSTGEIIVVGDFLSYDGNAIGNVIRIKSNGAVDSLFGTGFNDIAESVAIQSNGKIIIGGIFLTYNAIIVRGIVRLNINTTIDAAFITTGIVPGDDISSIAIESNGKIILGGQFNSFNGTVANNIVRIDTTGSIDNSWDTGSGFNNSTSALGLTTTNSLYLTGFYTSFNGTPANRIISLNT